MINEVTIIGKVKQATERDDGKVLDLLVEYKRYYGYGDNAGFSVNTHNVYLVSNTAKLKQELDRNNESKHPTYIAVSGMLAERSLEPLEGSGQKYGPSQVYILGTEFHCASREIESSRCRAYFQGEVVWRDTKTTSNNKPMTKLIVKQSRQRKNRDGEAYTAYTAIPVTVFRDEAEVPFGKGDVAMFAGTLDSYEMREYPGVFTSGMTSFDYLGADFSTTEDEVPTTTAPAVSVGDDVAVAAPVGSKSTPASIDDSDLPF